MIYLKELFPHAGVLFLLLLLEPLLPRSEAFTVRGLPRRHNNICVGHAIGEFVGNPDDCKLFYLCIENGEAVEASCPTNMLFNPNNKLCDTATHVTCLAGSDGGALGSGGAGSSFVPLPPLETDGSGLGGGGGPAASEPAASELAEASRYCASLPSRTELNRITYIGSSLNCQHYYICYYGQALRQECSANLHWNADIGACDLPENAGCVLGPVVSGGGGATLPLQTGSIGAGSGGIGGGGIALGGGGLGGTDHSNVGELINCPAYGQHVFPHMERCDFFIYCVKGHAILQNCPFYYHFDVVEKSCKSRRQALCVRDLGIGFQPYIYG